MATPSLFLIGTPPELFFTMLLLLDCILAYVLFAVAFLVSFILFLALIISMQLLRWMNCGWGTKRQSQPCGCCRWMKTVFLSMGRLLCVNMFPALFKKHKTRSVRSSQMTRVFMVFLGRKVENDLVLVAAFCSIVYIIFALAALVFIQYFPVHVEYSEECHKEDSHGRALFCYEYGLNSSQPWPVDCSMYNQTEISPVPGAHNYAVMPVLNCYSIAFPGFGVGIAAAFGFAKVAIIGITIFVKIAEGVFTMTVKGSRKLQEWHQCHSSTCLLSKTLQMIANITFIVLSLAILAIMIAVTCCISLATVQNVNTKALPLKVSHQFYINYIILAPLIFFTMAYILIKLPFHCKQGEYTSLAKEQRPPNPLDWDVESELSVAVELKNECATTEQAPTESHSDSDMTVMMTEGTQPGECIDTVYGLC